MMKSLLLNEWITFRHAVRAMAFTLAAVTVILAASFMNGSSIDLVALVNLFSTLAAMVPLYMCIQAFASDEKSHWGEALLALPSAPRSHVVSRYLFCLMSLAICFGFSFAADSMAAAMLEGAPWALVTDGFYDGILLLPAVILCFALVLLSLLMPLLHAFGQKGLVSILILPAIAIAASFAGPGAAAPADFIHSCPKGMLAAGFICAGLALYALSCLISSAILKRRSF